jgi:hypothetical protein
MTHTQDRMLTLASLVGMATTGAAAMTIWLLFTQPLTVADAVSAHDLGPLVRTLAGALVDAMWAVVRYL